MAARPYWNGQIKLSLVSLPVNVYAATNAAKTIPLHEIYKPTGQRVKHQNVVDDEPVDREDIIKGYEFEKGEYVLLEPEEIQKLKIPSSKTLEITQFVSTKEIDPIYFEKPYYVVPQDAKSEDAFIVIRDALSKSGKYGLGQLVIAGRERLCALKPYGSGMMLEAMRYSDEIRKADAYFEDIKEARVTSEELQLAEQLIKQKTAKFNPSQYHDHYREALQELIDSKIEHRAPKFEEEEKPRGKVINLMDALKKSLNEKGGSTKGKAKAKSKAPAKSKTKAKPKAKPKAKAGKKARKRAA